MPLDERLGDPLPPPNVDPWAFNGQRQDGRPQEDLLAVHCFCVCSGSALLGDLLGVSRSMERDLLSVLSIYPRIFLHVFIVYRLLVGFLFVVIVFWCWCVLVVLVKLSVLAKWLAIERPLWWHLYEVRRLSPQSPGGRAWLCVFSFVWFVYFVVCFPPALHNIYFIRLWHDIAYMCWKCR